MARNLQEIPCIKIMYIQALRGKPPTGRHTRTAHDLRLVADSYDPSGLHVEGDDAGFAKDLLPSQKITVLLFQDLLQDLYLEI